MSRAASSPRAFRRIGLVGRTGQSSLPDVLERLREIFRKHGAEIVFKEFLNPGDPLKPDVEGAPEEEVDLVVTLGGDGTLLWGARMVAERNIPVLGINLGHMGFLTSITADGVEESLERLFGGDYLLDCRSTLEALVVDGEGIGRRRFLALNDFVVHKGGMARVTHLSLWVGEGEGRQEIGRISGDGVVLSTPTGSTAYSLSAGGPIVSPAMECILVTPICPHTLAMRPLVIPAQETLTVRPLERSGSLVLTVDGQAGTELAADELVVVRQGFPRVCLVRFPGQAFFSTLREKLGWAVRHPETERSMVAPKLTS